MTAKSTADPPLPSGQSTGKKFLAYAANKTSASEAIKADGFEVNFGSLGNRAPTSEEDVLITS